jgi:hypothetical protein
MEPHPRRGGIYTSGSSKPMCDTMLDVNNPARGELVHKIFTSKFLRETNQGPLPKEILVLFLSLYMLVSP